MQAKTTGGDKLKKFTDSLLGMKFESVQVGYFKTSKYPIESGGKQVAEIAVHHEFGAPNAKIPARPTMRPAVFKLNKELPRLIQMWAEQDIKNPQRFAKQLPELIGARCAGIIQKFIALKKRPPLAEYTLERRRTRKINRTLSEKPLIDTGQMRLSVSYAVGNKKPKK